MKKILLTLTLLSTSLLLNAAEYKQTTHNVLEDFFTITEAKWYIAGNSLFVLNKEEKNLYGLSLGTRLYYPYPLYAIDIQGGMEVAKRMKKVQFASSLLFFFDSFKHFHYYVGTGALVYYKTEKIVDDWGVLLHNSHAADLKISGGMEIRAPESNHIFIESYFTPLETSFGISVGTCF